MAGIHGLAMSWLSREIEHGWASCPLTQNGCVRVMSQPSYPGALPAAQVAERLSEAAESPDHKFWPANVSLLGAGLFDWSRVLGHRQVTEVYLLSLAVRNNGRLVTLAHCTRGGYRRKSRTPCRSQLTVDSAVRNGNDVLVTARFQEGIGQMLGRGVTKGRAGRPAK